MINQEVIREHMVTYVISLFFSTSTKHSSARNLDEMHIIIFIELHLNPK